MIEMKVNAAVFALVQAELEKLPKLVQASAFEGGLRPAANVVAERMRQLAPRSQSTGSTQKWSEKTKQSRAGESPLHENIKVKMIRPKGSFAFALVGYSWPGGNKGHFVSRLLMDSREQVLWGKQTGKRVPKKDDSQRQAFDQTKSQQKTAFIGGVRKTIQSKLRTLAVGRR